MFINKLEFPDECDMPTCCQEGEWEVYQEGIYYETHLCTDHLRDLVGEERVADLIRAENNAYS